MKIGILKYPGGHGDMELMHILSRHFKMEVREVWYKERGPIDIDLLFIGGGFPCIEMSTGLNCLDESPLIQNLPEFAASGHYIVGLGNGFQLLCEAGLLPGKLEKNSSGRFICKQVFIKPENYTNVITSGLRQEEVYRLPLATNYGRFVADESIVMKMRQEGQILFRFCDYEGRITESVNFTGSMDNIAVICNMEKNVFGMIPQPERAIVGFNSATDGNILIGSFLEELSFQR